MTDQYKVYTKVLKALKEKIKLSHPGHVLTLAMMIAGLVTSRKAQLPRVSAEIATDAWKCDLGAGSKTRALMRM
jgi:hypothetical protein